MYVLCESYVKGQCSGFQNRETVFELEDGKVFQQDEYKYHYKHLYRPKAKVYQEGSTYFLELEGILEKVKVKRIR